MTWPPAPLTLQWLHNERDGVSNHRRLDCLLNRLSRRRSMETSKLCVTGLCEGNSTVTGEFPAQRASNAKKFLFDDVIMDKLRRHRSLVQSIWGQNGPNPPQIATKLKLALCCRKFCVDFRDKKFTKINPVEHFQISQFLWEPWGKILKK